MQMRKVPMMAVVAADANEVLVLPFDALFPQPSPV